MSVPLPTSNWANSYRYQADKGTAPTSVAQIQDLVADSTRLHTLGTRHSFTDVADTEGTLLSLAVLPETIDLNADGHRVTVSAATTFSTLGPALHGHGWALRTLASLPHLSVAGAIATGTHGSGLQVPSLSAQVRSLELIDGGANPRIIDDDETLNSTAIHLGLLGVVTAVTFDVVPAQPVRQYVFENVPWSSVKTQLLEVMGVAPSVSLFTNWADPTISQMWTKGTEPLAVQELFGARAATRTLHMIPGADPAPVTEQLGIAGPWHERFPHFRADATPSHGDELQSEYYVPLEYGVQAIQRVRDLGEKLAPALYVSEIRTVAKDALWLSGSSGSDALALHFTWKKEPERVRQLCALIEEALGDLQVRPHWGKVFAMDAQQLQEAYPRLPEFNALRQDFDPEGKFTNAWSRRLLGR